MDWNFLIKNKESLYVTTDSRKVTPGCVFVAIKGEHFDGNDFVEQAKRDGAAYVISGPNAVAEMQDLARAWRRELGIQVIGITGTNGKTTTKELTASVLKTKYNLLYTQGNLNNSLGVPLTVLSITRQHNLALIEMGASHPGDITELVNVCEPNCGLITNVGKAHLQGFGSFEGVMQTKRELYDFLAKHGGFCFLNADNPHLCSMYEEAFRDHKSAFRHPAAVLYHTSTMLEGTKLVGDYNSENIQAALAVGEYFGISRADGEAAIRAYVPSNNRSQLMQTDKNTVVVDAYNANVTSMTAAISAFKGDTLILGDMLELGDYSATEHQHIVDLILEKGFDADKVFLIGSEFAGTQCPFRKFATVDDFHEELTGRHILLKGSHGIHLEKLIPVL